MDHLDLDPLAMNKLTIKLERALYYKNKRRKVPLEMVNAGDHCPLNISKQILPLAFIFG